MVAEDVILTLPDNVANLIKALGGILFLYLVFGIISNLIAFRRNRKIDEVISSIHEISKDMKSIKKFLVKKL